MTKRKSICIAIVFLVFCISMSVACAEFAYVEIKGIPRMGQRTGYYLPDEVGNTQNWDKYINTLYEGKVADCGVASLAMVEGYFKGYESNSVLLYHYTLQAINPDVKFETVSRDPEFSVALGESFNSTEYNEGYTVTSVIDYNKVYASLVLGIPVMIHCIGTSHALDQHWAVIYKYEGSVSDTIDPDKFWLLSPYVPVDSASRNQCGDAIEVSFKDFCQGRNINSLVYRATTDPEKGLKTVPVRKEVKPNTIDFGTIYEGYRTTVRRILTVQNDGSQTVLLDDLRQPENFTFKDFSKTELAPGESATIVVEPNIGLKDGIYDVQVNLSTDIIVMSEPVELKLTVKEKPALPYTEPCPECLGNNLLLVESYMGNWTDNGDGTHSGLAQLTYDIICVDCAMWITNVVASDSTTYTMMHSFEDGVCTDCGLNLIKCDHGIGAYESLGYNQINRDPTVCLNEEFHYLPYTMTETFKCTICGERFEETWNMEIDEAHDYDEKGLCSCGAKGEPTTCKHENIEQRMMDENAVYSNITETEHTKVADAYSVNWCLDCETRRTHQLWTPGQVTIERHSFADGICVCGYDNRCIHEFVDGVCCICGKHYLDNVNRIYTLPVGMRIVREEAFLGCPAEAIIISEGCTEIEKRAFAECIALKYVALPASIKMIADDAFDGCEGVTIFAPEGSLAHLYAAEKGFVWCAK